MEQKTFSNRIIWFNFVLSVFVVWVHAVNVAGNNVLLADSVAAGQGGAVRWTEHVLANLLGQMAVPGFFMTSAYLFYRNLASFQGICEKWRTRFYSVFVPYCAWNLIYYALHVLLGDAPLSMGELNRAIAYHSWNPVFWYVYQLIWLILLAPLLYWLIKDARIAVFSLFLMLLAVYRRWDLPLLNEDALFYYTLGAAAAGHLRAFVEEDAEPVRRGRCFTGILLAAFVLLFGGLKLRLSDAGSIVLLTVLIRACMPAALWGLLSALKLPEAPAFMRIGFFLYATHYLVIRAFAKLFGVLIPVFAVSAGTGVLPGAGGVLQLLQFLGMPLVCVCCAMIGARLLRTCLPLEWKVLSGGR